MARSQLDKTLIALAGEFLVAGQLCLKGYVASLTLKNYPGVDIFCLNPTSDRQVAIQVKTKRGVGTERGGYFVPEGDLRTPFVFVYIDGEGVKYYVVPGPEVRRLANEQRDRDGARHPNRKREQPLMLSVTNIAGYQNRWDLLWEQES
jgi:hypothetical protein